MHVRASLRPIKIRTQKRQSPYFGSTTLRMFQVWLRQNKRVQYMLYTCVPDVSQDILRIWIQWEAHPCRPNRWRGKRRVGEVPGRVYAAFTVVNR